MPYPSGNSSTSNSIPATGNVVANQIYQYGSAESTSAWNSFYIVAGGMKFQWSTATANSGTLTWVATGSNPPSQTAGTQFARLFTNNSSIVSSTDNQGIWPSAVTSATNAFNATNLGSAYTSFDIYLTVRGSNGHPYQGATWKVFCASTGSDTLIMTVEYWGLAYS